MNYIADSLIAADHKSEQNAKDQYAWTKQWYPVAVLEDLPLHKPTPVQLLGKALVLWTNGDGQWQCFEDVCPHRYCISVIPLSASCRFGLKVLCFASTMQCSL